jgi:hypothetical protein
VNAIPASGWGGIKRGEYSSILIAKRWKGDCTGCQITFHGAAISQQPFHKREGKRVICQSNHLVDVAERTGLLGTEEDGSSQKYGFSSHGL